jgi:hypothetical protein
MLRVHCAVPEVRSVPRTWPLSARGGVARGHLHSVSAVIASGKRPVPFRTRKLSPIAPMVLRGGPRGRVGRRRTYFDKTATRLPGWPSSYFPPGMPRTPTKGAARLRSRQRGRIRGRGVVCRQGAPAYAAQNSLPSGSCMIHQCPAGPRSTSRTRVAPRPSSLVTSWSSPPGSPWTSMCSRFLPDLPSGTS